MHFFNQNKCCCFFFFSTKNTYNVQHMKRALMQFVDNVGPAQHAHLCSLIWAFSVSQHILLCPLNLLADNKGPDQPALMGRLIRACTVCKLHKGPFCELHMLLLLITGYPDFFFVFYFSTKTHAVSIHLSYHTKEMPYNK